jgi:tRNA-splicing ligase RtcB
VKRVVIIGAGPAGMMAAIAAAANGASVILLEKKNQVGRKLSITGKGRCNLTTAVDQDSLIRGYPGNGRFLYGAFGQVLKMSENEMGLEVVYDVAHNIAKWENHRGQRLLVHRKGATRALPPGHPDNPPAYRDTGHPVLVPGSMGTASYVLVGTDLAAESFYSVNHGAGRTLSRRAAARSITREEFEAGMGEVLYNTRNYRDVVDEAPQAYKDIDQVVDTLADIGLTRKIARLRPLAVIKGKD